jgi:pyruvate dehydrogenase E1 component alpha subunit
MLIAQGHSDESSLAAIESEIDAALTDAVDFALASPYPPIEELRRDILDVEVEI